MKKIVIYSITLCLALSVLTGCGAKKENTDDFSGPVIIQAGDSAVGSGGKKETQSSSESNVAVDNSVDVNTENNQSSEKDEDKLNLTGVWLGNQGSCLEIHEDTYNAYLNGSDIGGTYTLDGNKLSLSYSTKTEIEDATEEQKLLGKNFIISDELLECKVESYNEGVTFILNYGTSKEVFKYFGEVHELDDSTSSEITDEAELEAIRQELINQGINPDTGLKIEDEQKLIEMGIDPLTGLPLEIEETEETVENITNNKN